ncbi:hypothetical protein HHK36_013247 [Tetracentron sinense]|uniref:CRM domain-containing protein n=1 Tax=Tetracentron sinense TaxID=13715 RepID=A0A834ZAS3_TETSI|nr:hypothetical protein HHK36_013247 [Tetracentron sinense]
MASRLFHILRRASIASLVEFSSNSHFFRPNFRHSESISSSFQAFVLFNPWKPSWVFRNLSHGTVNLVISQGKPKFETHEVEPPKKEKWKTKKRLKLQRKKEKQKRKSANKRDPRHIGVKGKKKNHKFANPEERIKYKIEKAKIKEALLIERLKRYEVSKLQGPVVEPEYLTGEERFYMKKMAQKGSNYVPVGRRGVFGGVILNMHLHWKKHETVKVICKPCKPGQALEKSKYEQSLESVRRFIAIAEKELELYYRHVALYGDPSCRSSYSAFASPRKGYGGEPRRLEMIGGKSIESTSDGFSTDLSEVEVGSTDPELSETEVDSEGEHILRSEVDNEDEDLSGNEFDSSIEEWPSSLQERSTSILGSSSMVESRWDSDNLVSSCERTKILKF